MFFGVYIVHQENENVFAIFVLSVRSMLFPRKNL